MLVGRHEATEVWGALTVAGAPSLPADAWNAQRRQVTAVTGCCFRLRARAANGHVVTANCRRRLVGCLQVRHNGQVCKEPSKAALAWPNAARALHEEGGWDTHKAKARSLTPTRAKGQTARPKRSNLVWRKRERSLRSCSVPYSKSPRGKRGFKHKRAKGECAGPLLVFHTCRARDEHLFALDRAGEYQWALHGTQACN